MNGGEFGLVGVEEYNPMKIKLSFNELMNSDQNDGK